MLQKRTRGGKGVRSSGADGYQAVIRFDDIAVAGKNKGGLAVGNNEQRFQVSQGAILTPLLGQLHGRLLEIPRKLLELALKALEKGDRIGSRSGKPGDNLVTVKAACLARGVLHHMIAHGYLTISDEHNFVLSPHAQNGGALYRRASLTVTHPVIIPPKESGRQNPVKQRATAACRKENSGIAGILSPAKASGKSRRRAHRERSL